MATFEDLVTDVVDEIFERLDPSARFVLTFVNRTLRIRYGPRLDPEMDYIRYLFPYLAEQGYAAQMEWFFNTFVSDEKKPLFQKDREPSWKAAHYGHFDVLRFLDAQGASSPLPIASFF